MLEPAEWEFWDTWMRAQRLLARELDRGLQRDCGISKAEFSVLMTLSRPDAITLSSTEMSGRAALKPATYLSMPVSQDQ
ncbi:hypothetical protein ABZW17_46625, partial [Amycolatopsis sp. NPDC004625]